MKPTSKYTDSELLALNPEEFSDSVRLEAIHRGIKPPVTLSESLKQSEWKGYRHPTNGVSVWCIHATASYTHHTSSFGYLSQDAAERALEGMVYIDSTYRKGASVLEIKTGAEFSVVRQVIGGSIDQHGIRLQEYLDESTDKFDEVRNECLERFRQVHQNHYDTRVRKERRAEYVRLARGNEEVAADFWKQAERTDWPDVDGNLPTNQPVTPL